VIVLRTLLSQRRARLALACSLGSVALLGLAPTAIAQGEGADANAPQIIAVDMSTDPQALITRSDAPPSDAAISVNDTPASVSAVVTPAELGYQFDSVVVIDNSSTSAPRLDVVKAAVKAYFASLGPTERGTVMSLPAKLEVGLSQDVDAIGRAVDGATPAGDANVYDAISASSALLATQSSFRSITAIVASADRGSLATAEIARAEAIAAKVPINFVALVSTDFPAGETSVYQQLAAQTGGQFLATDDPAQLATIAGQLGSHSRNVHAVQFQTDQAATGGNVELVTGSQRVEVGFVPDTLTQGVALRDIAGDSGGGLPFLGFFEGSNGLLVILVLGALAAGGIALAIALLMTKQDDGLTSVLQPYSPEADDDGEGGGFGKSAFIQRAVGITTSIAERQGYLVKAEKMLEQANMPLRAGEALTGYVGIIFGSMILGFLYKQSLFWALIFGVVGALLPPNFVSYKAKRRRKKFVSQLPDTLQLLAGTLKAGYSFMQGVEAVSHEVEDPMGSEFRRVVTEAQLGRPVEEALETSAIRMNSPDFEWAVMAVRIQREVGGNLSELLMTVAETMTARQRLRGEVSALTAEGRVSAMVLGILPLGLGAMLWTINPEYMNLLFEDPKGKIMLVGSTLLAGAGFLWMKKIIDIKI
jgi:tight adherence protein B